MIAPLAAAEPTSANDIPLVQSLAQGAAGAALLHIERAHAGSQTWQAAHAWVRAATSNQITAASHAGLYYGAPAISFVLHAAQADGKPRYRTAAATMNAHVSRLTERRLKAANARIDRGEFTRFSEYDLFYGLTGIGALMLRHTPEADVLRPLLGYLVRLTQPHASGLPGWWVAHDPDAALPTPGGHANLGMAHGITGVLSLLSSAHRRGVIVDGQSAAIHQICCWLDRWQQDGSTGPWWPQWITQTELDTGRVVQSGPPRPSWCYGTAGIARAQQLAAIALGNTVRQHRAENALVACLTDPAQLQLIKDPGLCHGVAGLYQTAWRAAHDALTPMLTSQLPSLAHLLNAHAKTITRIDVGLLNGAVGLALALHTTTHSSQPPRSGWDACLLID